MIYVAIILAILAALVITLMLYCVVAINDIEKQELAMLDAENEKY